MAETRSAMLLLLTAYLLILPGGGDEVYSAPGGGDTTGLTCEDDIGNTFKEGDTVWLDFGSRKCLCANGQLTECNDAYQCPRIPEDCVETRDIPDYCTVCTKQGCKTHTEGQYLSIGESKTYMEDKACRRCECKAGGKLECVDVPDCE